MLNIIVILYGKQSKKLFAITKKKKTKKKNKPDSTLAVTLLFTLFCTLKH